MQNFNNTKKAALDIARAVTAKLWYKVIKDVSDNKTKQMHIMLGCVGKKY